MPIVARRIYPLPEDELRVALADLDLPSLRYTVKDGQITSVELDGDDLDRMEDAIGRECTAISYYQVDALDVLMAALVMAADAAGVPVPDWREYASVIGTDGLTASLH